MEKKNKSCKDCNKETHILCWRCVEPICSDCLTSYGLRHYCKGCYKIEFKTYKDTKGDLFLVTRNKWSEIFLDMVQIKDNQPNPFFSQSPKRIRKKDFNKMVEEKKYTEVKE